ncbi:MAG: LPS export ABC transporter periplasmic protein LptC [Deltaproteobacteria bacterium]|nr:LPS export ABC transporter periplasmic protein LptC [Deltaproteobacteria bacterium]
MKRALAIVLVLAFLAGAAALGKYILWPERLDTTDLKQLDVDLSLKGVELSQGRDGKKLWNLKASEADYVENTDELTLAAPIITYWGEGEEPPMQVMAPKGQVWQKEDRARMWDGVNGTRGEYAMRADSLDYTGTRREILLTGNVQLVGKTMLANSNTLTYFLENGDFLAQGNVQVIMN